MNRHLASVHGKKKPFKCDVCKYSCFQKCDIEKHKELFHEKQKPLRCDICDYSFLSKSSMKIHVESLHEQKKTFKCDICVAQKGDLKKHLEEVHEKRNHSCDNSYSKCYPRHDIEKNCVSSCEKEIIQLF
jgi:KRAB domain-containing zinc finger protein